jgi:beta-lactamase class D
MRAITVVALLLGSAVLHAKAPDLVERFRDLDGCVIIYDLKHSTKVLQYGDARCTQRLPPCSTFKVPLALMGFDAGAIKDANTTFKWDGKKHWLPSWNADQTAASWIKNSTLWVSQVLAERLGLAALKRYLADFRYGTQDMSGGLRGAWLTVGPDDDPQLRATLLISAQEQLELLARMWRGQLHVSPRALELTRQVTLVEQSPKGYVLHGKTGTGFLGPRHDLRLGWFVAHLANAKAEYVAVVSFTERRHREPYATYAGSEAREILKSILRELGLW